MKVICFKGKGKTGKTTIIKRILNEFFNIEIHKKYNDFVISFLINGKLIGICSYGDTLKDVKDNIEIFLRKKCDIIICASVTYGEVVNYYKSKFGEDINWIERNSSSVYFGNPEFQQFIEIFKRNYGQPTY